MDEIYAGTRETLEFAGKLINFRSGKFGYSICPLFSKGLAEFFREFWHDFAKNRPYVVNSMQVPREALEFAETSINFRSGKFGYSICSFFSKGHAEIFRELC